MALFWRNYIVKRDNVEIGQQCCHSPGSKICGSQGTGRAPDRHRHRHRHRQRRIGTGSAGSAPAPAPAKRLSGFRDVTRTRTPDAASRCCSEAARQRQRDVQSPAAAARRPVTGSGSGSATSSQRQAPSAARRPVSGSQRQSAAVSGSQRQSAAVSKSGPSQDRVRTESGPSQDGNCPMKTTSQRRVRAGK